MFFWLIAAAAGLLFLTRDSSASTGSRLTTPSLPAGVAAVHHEVTATGGVYDIATYPPDAVGDTFHVARLLSLNGPAAIEPNVAWLAYVQHPDGTRTKHSEFAPGPPQIAQAVLDTMTRDQLSGWQQAAA